MFPVHLDRVFAYLTNVFIDVEYWTAAVHGSGVTEFPYAFELLARDLGRISLSISDFLFSGATG